MSERAANTMLLGISPAGPGEGSPRSWAPLPTSAAGLAALRRRWLARRAVAGLALGLGLAALTFAFWSAGQGARATGVLVAACGGLAGLLPWVWRRAGSSAGRDGVAPGLRDLARHLDRVRPEMQESAELLLHEPRALSPLARAQQLRAAAALARLGRRGVLPWRGPAIAVAAGVASAGLALALGLSPATLRPTAASIAPVVGGGAPTTHVRDLRVTVTPPGYTGHPAHSGDELNARAEQGARVVWTVRVAGPADQATLLFGDDTVTLTRAGDGTFAGERQAGTSELYALRIQAAGREVWRSPSARLEVLPDRPPVLAVEQPQALTEVPPEHPGILTLAGQANDDYGLAGVELLITAVAGGGEQISVHEERRALALDARGRFEVPLDLAALGVRKDTELYLRVEATDRRLPAPNRTRSETLRVRAVGPQELAAAGLDAGLRLQPVLEYFRSERQIILDTEKLLAEAPRIARAEFEQRSQSLAFDQRALRLRYGALLGEEFESGVAVEAGAEDVEHVQVEGQPAAAAGGGEPASGEAEQAPAHKLGKAAQAAPRIEDILPAGMVHQHDAQDEATFFTGALRTQLKAVLAEMWGAEGQLRVFDPQRALPYENRALVLLKELQQQARVYVPKIGYEAPEIDLARRLQGELDKIHDLAGAGPAARPDAQEPLRRALGAVASPDTLAGVAPGDLAAARQALSQAALAGDADALAGVDALRALEGGSGAVTEAQRLSLLHALWRTLPPPNAAPTPAPAGGALEQALRARAGGAP